MQDRSVSVWVPLVAAGVVMLAASPLLLQCNGGSKKAAQDSCERFVETFNAACGSTVGDASAAECDLTCLDCPDSDAFDSMTESFDCMSDAMEGASDCDNTLAEAIIDCPTPDTSGCETLTKDTGEATQHSSDTVPAKVPDKPETDIIEHRSRGDNVTGPPAVAASLRAASLDVCAGASFPTGDVLVFVMHLAGPVPAADGTWLYQYGFVMDVDADLNNNYKASANYPNDFFDSTDRWYVANYDPTGGWVISVSNAQGGNPVPMTSNACISIRDDRMILTVPRSEFTIPLPHYRVTAFAHQGDFGLNPPYTWSGDVEPPVGEPLLYLPL